MGKRIISQRRGRGTTTYRSPSFRYKGAARHKSLVTDEVIGVVEDIIHCPGHSAPLASIVYDDGEVALAIAPEGIKVGDLVNHGGSDTSQVGSVFPLSEIPEGTLIFNIESKKGDGGKFVRSSGTYAKVVSKTEDKIIVILPSKKRKSFHPTCRATIGVVAGGGRVDKPLLKAGVAYYKYKAKNKLWPKVSGSAMNAADHPFGNSRTLRKARAKPISRHAPPGKKVGSVAARRTGRKKK